MKKFYSFLVILALNFAVNAQTDINIGSATGSNTGTTYPAPLQDWYEGSRAQYLYLASELQAAGMTPGLISSIKYNATSLNTFTGTIEGLTISIGTTTTASLTNTNWEPGTTPVYGPVDYVPRVGTNEIQFCTPFEWDGVSNIIIEICNGNAGNAVGTWYTNNPSFPNTSGLAFNGSHIYRADNVGSLCGTTNVTDNSLSPQTTRPDITFAWTANTTCSGTPIAGITSSNKGLVCINESFTLTVSGGLIASGLSYQWQMSTNNGVSWTDITGANCMALDYSTGITTPTCFRRQTLCGNSGLSSYSTMVCITMKPFYECYCNPLIGNDLYSTGTAQTIESVDITGGTVTYNHSHTGANPAPSLAYELVIGDTSTLQLKQGATYTAAITASANPTAGAMWIDWNHNNIFDSAEYTAVSFTAAAATVDIDVPATASLGLTMVRFRTASTTMTFGNACALFTNGEVEDYLVKIISGTTCTGTPTGGTTASTKDSSCPNTQFTLSVTGATSGVTGLTYQWEYQNNCTGGWTPISGATNKTYTVPSISTNMCYRRKITCGGNSVYSTVITVYIKPLSDCYCGPNTGIQLQGGSSPFINNIGFAELGGGSYTWDFVGSGGVNDNTVGTGLNTAYHLYNDTNYMAHVEQAKSYTLTVTQSAAPTQAAIWIDYDHSGTLDVSERQNLTIAGTSSTFDINIPPTALTGITLMRVRIRAANIDDACSQNFSGETEDYVLYINQGAQCSGTPTPGDTKISADSVCKNTPFILSVDNATTGVIGIKYKWYISTNNGSTWDSIAGANNLTYTVPSISSDACFRRGMKCGSNSEVFSTQACIILKSQFQCYCGIGDGAGLHSGTSPLIDSVHLSDDCGKGANVDYMTANLNHTTNGYHYYEDTSLAPVLTQSQPYTVKVSSSGTPNQAAVWIDWDQSGTFENATEMYNLPVTSATGIITITPPSNALPGFTLMRVRIRGGTFTTACDQFFSGETEDHIVKIKAAIACSATPASNVINSTNLSACKGLSFTVSANCVGYGYSGLKYQWQDSIPGGIWKKVSGNDSASTYTTSLDTSSRYFRRKVTCANGGGIAYSNVVLVSLIAPIYAALPFSESFENTWLDGCDATGGHSIPTNNFRNSPLTGDSSWRRNDDGATANWTNATSGQYFPFASNGTKSARLHTLSMGAGGTSNLDLYLNCTGGATYKRMTFDYVNVDGSDLVDVLISTNGGTTFTKIDSVGNRAAWSSKKIDFASSSAKTIIRFRGYSDGGASTDIGLDNINVVNLPPIDVAAVSIVAPTGSIGANATGKIIINIKNVGGSVLDFAATPMTLSIVGKDGNNNPVSILPKTINTGSLGFNSSRNDTVNADLSVIGTWVIRGVTKITGDATAANDTTANSSFVVNSAVKYAVSSGFWGDGATWNNGVVPVATDTVNITGFTVTLSGGAQPSPYFCSSLGIGAGGSLIGNADVLTIGPAGGGNKVFSIASGGSLSIANANITHNGNLIFNNGANYAMTGGSLTVDGNDGTNIGSVQSGTDILGIGTTSTPYTSGNLSLTGGTITITDPHRFGNTAFAYRSTNNLDLTTSTNTLVLGSPTSTHTSNTGTNGISVNLTSGGGKLSLQNLTIAGGNTVGNRFANIPSSIGINGTTTINANSELRSSSQVYFAGNIVNNGVMATNNIINFQTYLAGTAGIINTPQTISGSGVYRNTIPTVTIVNAGTGYAEGNIITVVGGTSITPLNLYVSSVNGSGGITSAVVLNMGNYTVAPSASSSVVGGTGSGATVTLGSVIANANFTAIVVNNNNAGLNITSFGTALAAQTGTISGLGLITMKAGIVNNSVPIVLGTSITQRGTLQYTSGFFTGKFTRWFNTATNITTTGDFPVGKGLVPTPARVEFTTAPTKGGTLTAEFIASPSGLGGLPLTDGAVTLTSTASNGYWRIDTDSITGGNYTMTLTDSGLSSVTDITGLRIVKRPSFATDWTLNGTAGTNSGTTTKPVVVRTGMGGFSEFTIAGDVANPLPSTSIKLYAEKSNNSNKVSWVSANEIDVKLYDVQVSTDGRTFETISTINAKGNGTNAGNTTYNFDDTKNNKLNVYYRIKQTSKDGKAMYSNVLFVGSRASALALNQVYPNPTKDILNVSINSVQNTNATITITDVLGKQVAVFNKTLQQGENNVTINVANLATATYMLSITDAKGHQSSVISFVKGK